VQVPRWRLLANSGVRAANYEPTGILDRDNRRGDPDLCGLLPLGAEDPRRRLERVRMPPGVATASWRRSPMMLCPASD